MNLLEKVEKVNAVAFLEKWLPDILDLETFPAPLIIERAHRVPGAPQSSAPRVIIIKFLNFEDNVQVMQASRKKGRIMFENYVMFFHDMSTELHRKRKLFDGVKQRLQAMKIDCGLIYPAKFGLIYEGKIRVFADRSEVESLITNLKT